MTGVQTCALPISRLVTELLPDEPEADGLLALMHYCESRRSARVDADGGFVPLSEQDTVRWDVALHDAAEGTLRRAAAKGRPGPFQIEAAIQSAHMQRLRGGATPWTAIAGLYDALANTGARGVLVSRAMAHAEAFGTGAGLVALWLVAEDTVRSYQPYWVARATLEARAGRTEAAAHAFNLALGLTESPALRTHIEGLQRRLNR